MKQKEIIELTTPEIQERIEDHIENLSKLRMNHTVSPIENPMSIREAKKTVARLKTELNKRQRQEATEAKKETKE